MPKIGDIKKEFRINKYITLKLEWSDYNEPEGYRTVVYVGGEEMLSCKKPAFQINADEVKQYKHIDSIDELEYLMGKQNEVEIDISPEEEFWGHCSNIQTWAEHEYDTRLLHSNLAFPLLERLYKLGDPIAKRHYAEDVAYRLRHGTPEVQRMLLADYAPILPHDELLRAALVEEEYEFVRDFEQANGFECLLGGTSHIPIIYRNLVKESGKEIYLKVENRRIIYLKVIDAPLHEIPDSISALKQLKAILIMNTPLEILPESISELLRLEGLTVFQSKLKVFPNIKNLIYEGALTRVNLSFNGLNGRSIPQSIFLGGVVEERNTITSYNKNKQKSEPVDVYNFMTWFGKRVFIKIS